MVEAINKTTRLWVLPISSRISYLWNCGGCRSVLWNCKQIRIVAHMWLIAPL